MASRRTSKGVTDAAVYSATGSQELTSILNAPEVNPTSTWLAWPFVSTSTAAEVPPPLPPGILPEVRLEDFARYLSKVGDKYDNFEQELAASEDRIRRKVTLNSEEVKSSQGQGLVAALREVPAVFFQEAFELDRPEVWGLLGEVQTEEGRQEALEKLGHYLDMVETHLVREIAARSDNFFDAAGYIQDLQSKVYNVYQQVSAMRSKMSELEKESEAAVQVSQHLQMQRANAIATLDALKAVEEVAQAQVALRGLLPQAAGGGGMAADFVGAIDVLEVLQGVLDNQDLLALDCFRTLPQQIAETAQAVDDLMATDFLERARFAAEGPATARILQRLTAQLAAIQTPRGGAREAVSSGQRSPFPIGRLSSEGSSGEGSVEALAAVKLTDQVALNRVVAWVEGAGQEEESSSAVGAETLQDVLLPLVMGMRRMGRLSAAVKDLGAASAAGLRDLIRRVVEECLGVLAPRPSDSIHLVAVRASSPSPNAPSTTELLQQLPGEHFQWVLEAVLLAVQAYFNHFTRVATAVQSVLLAAKAPGQQLTAVAEECREVCQGLAEVAIGRWAKLLSGRAHGATAAALRLDELREVLNVTDVLAALSQAQGIKSVLPLRNALHQLCKATLDTMHSKAVGKLTTLLEQDHWSPVEVAPQFQRVVDRLQASVQYQTAVVEHVAAAEPLAVAEDGDGLSMHQEAAVGALRPDSAGQVNGTVDSAEHASSEAAAAGAAAVVRADGSSQATTSVRPHSGRRQQDLAVLRKFTITPQEEAGGSNKPKEVLVIDGQRYHVVNTALLLLNMLGDYMAFRDAVPSFTAEVAQRVLELLKIFNSRTCQLVLGAGAMQVSGLKSITAKHLAISCQCLGVFIALHPVLSAAFTQAVPQPRRDMLTADFTRTVQDYIIHRDEICSKLVFIMRERLSMNLKQLPAIAASWPSGPLPSPRHQQTQEQLQGLPAPSSFAATNVKQLHILSGVLSPLLLPEETYSIFSRVGHMFSNTLVEAFGLLEARGPAWELQLKADVLTLLECLEELPIEPEQQSVSLERLRLFYKQRFQRKQHQSELQQLAPDALPEAAVDVTRLQRQGDSSEQHQEQPQSMGLSNWERVTAAEESPPTGDTSNSSAAQRPAGNVQSTSSSRSRQGLDTVANGSAQTAERAGIQIEHPLNSSPPSSEDTHEALQQQPSPIPDVEHPASDEVSPISSPPEVAEEDNSSGAALVVDSTEPHKQAVEPLSVDSSQSESPDSVPSLPSAGNAVSPEEAGLLRIADGMQSQLTGHVAQ